MKVTLSDNTVIKGLTLAEHSSSGVYVEDEDRKNDSKEHNYDGTSRFSGRGLVEVDGCVSVKLQGTEELTGELKNEYITYADNYADDMYDIEISPVDFAEQKTANSVYIEFEDGTSQTVSGTLECAYTY